MNNINKKAILRRKNDIRYGRECFIIYEYKEGVNPVVVEFNNKDRLSYEYYDLDILD